MDAHHASMPASTALFQVFLRLKPPQNNVVKQHEPWLVVEESPELPSPTHLTLVPPNESRKRAIERFSFTKIFQEQATQLELFNETGTADSIKEILTTGRDGLVATLGVTGSGKSHTILGSRHERGLTQMTLDVLFRSIGQHIRRPDHPELPTDTTLLPSLQACDPSEAQIQSAVAFLESMYGDTERGRHSRAQTPMVGGGSRAQTPMTVWPPARGPPGSFPASPPALSRRSHALYPLLPSAGRDSNVSNMSARSGAPVRLLPHIPAYRPERDGQKPPLRFSMWTLSAQNKRSAAKYKLRQESMPMYPPQRRPPLPRSSALPHVPDVSSYVSPVAPHTEYVVLVSMYEVYNDRIFDLLSQPHPSSGQAITTRAGAAMQKGLMRRPLLFKNTEMSPDRKVVAGLRKILCGSYEEAMMVLETGLTERRVAGTGSNSVSSRSHGFFCIEVKRNGRSQKYGYDPAEQWTGGTLSIVDLAGSERARNAKTTGSTLAEAGKINESLMYLGQCLQVQSDCQQDGSRPIVPFRQCKLTELLFSNSFPSKEATTAYRTPQKAIMIVTADPDGDFNATSQILRYSALAREVTVPRIPSVTSAILGNNTNANVRGRTASTEPHFSAEELEQAVTEIARLSDECDALSMQLAEEEIRRTEADLQRQAAEERAVLAEQEIREECWNEMERRLDEEKERWRAAWEEEKMRGEQYVDGKIEIIAKSAAGAVSVYEDTDTKQRAEEAERENAILRAKVQTLERELRQRSPTKKSRSTSKPSTALQEIPNANSDITTNPFLASLRPKPSQGKDEDTGSVSDISPRKLSLRHTHISINASSSDDAEENHEPEPQTPGTVVKKKQRKLTTRKWDLGDPATLDY